MATESELYTGLRSALLTALPDDVIVKQLRQRKHSAPDDDGVYMTIIMSTPGWPSRHYRRESGGGFTMSLLTRMSTTVQIDIVTEHYDPSELAQLCDAALRTFDGRRSLCEQGVSGALITRQHRQAYDDERKTRSASLDIVLLHTVRTDSITPGATIRLNLLGGL